MSPVLADITFQSAEVACTGLSAELFSVSKDMDVKTLMEERDSLLSGQGFINLQGHRPL